jgi:hypothetical protein
MMLLYKIGEDEIDKTATPVGLKQLVEIFKSADVYVAIDGIGATGLLEGLYSRGVLAPFY